MKKGIVFLILSIAINILQAQEADSLDKQLQSLFQNFQFEEVIHLLDQ